jgi:hypothetical protein
VKTTRHGYIKKKKKERKGKHESGSRLIYFTKINSRWIIDLKVKYRAIKFIEDKNLGELGFGDDFSDTIPKERNH